MEPVGALCPHNQVVEARGVEVSTGLLITSEVRVNIFPCLHQSPTNREGTFRLELPNLHLAVRKLFQENWRVLTQENWKVLTQEC